MIVKGLGISKGIACGKILKYSKKEINIENDYADDHDKELEHLNKCIELCIVRLEEIRESARLTIGEKEAEIFNSHILMLNDPKMIEEIKDGIRDSSFSAPNAVSIVSKKYINIMNSLNDEYMSQRAQDIKDVFERLLRIMTNSENVELSHIEEPIILVSEELTPSQTAQIGSGKVLGFITQEARGNLTYSNYC